jgi:hypothetical protein
MPRKTQKLDRLKCTSIEQILSCCYKLTLAQLKLIKEAIEIMIARLEDKELEPSGGRGRSELSSDFSRPYQIERKIEKVGVGVRGSTGYIELSSSSVLSTLEKSLAFICLSIANYGRLIFVCHHDKIFTKI